MLGLRRRNLGMVATVALAGVGAALATDYPLPLAYNFNGMVHSGEQFDPDRPDGFRSISDRALAVDGATGSINAGPIIGTGGITYQVNTTPFTLDIVHLGNRNQVDNGNWTFDEFADGDNIGTQPTWMPSVDQSAPQVTDLTSLGLTLDATADIGVLYQISNGGGSFRITLGFTDATSVSVVVQGPDWFQSQFPAGPGLGVAVQRQLGVYTGAQDVDLAATPAAALNVVEALISVQELINDGLGNVAGKTLASIAFSDRSSTVAGYAVIAATVRTGLGPPANDECAACTPVVDGTITASNARATGTDISACGTGDARDVWFCYTATSTGRVEARTCGSQFNTTLAVYSTCGGAAIACNDDGCGLASRVQWDAQSGQTYRIRVAGVNDAEGDFNLALASNVPQFSNRPLPLAYNFNGMVHPGEAGDPDAPAGYRAISDRGLVIDGGLNSFGSGTVLGTTGMVYSPILVAGALDTLHIGNRNVVSGGGFFFDGAPDGDNVGIQPTWLPNPDQSGPQQTNLAPLGIVMNNDSAIGVLFNISNGGGGFNCTLGFTDNSSVTVFLAGPDWFGAQTPINPDFGVEVQTQLGVFTGSGNIDAGAPSLPLNVQEAVITTQSLLAGGLGNVAGRTLGSITFSDITAPNGYGVYAATYRQPGLPPCPGDLNGDRAVGLSDLTILLSNFGTASGADPDDGDLDGDGDVDLSDLTAFLSNFGTVCN